MLPHEDLSYDASDFLRGCEGFNEKKPRIERPDLFEGFFVVGVAEDDNGNFGYIFVGCERFEHVKSIGNGHLEVKEDNVGVLGSDKGESGIAIVCGNNVKTLCCEGNGIHFSNIRLIVYQADFSPFCGEFWCRVVHKHETFTFFYCITASLG